MSSRLRDKVAIITGAGSGIGEASAKRFAAEGAAVLVADVDADGAERVVSEITAAGGRAQAAIVDVSDLEATERMAADAIEAFGTIDVLYANAGVNLPGNGLTCEPATWDKVVAINLTGAWYCVRAVLPAMVEAKRGSIILQASGAGMVGIRSSIPYAASKGGVIAMGRQLAADFGPDNIRVNCISPGTMTTPLVNKVYAQRVKEGRYADMDEALSESGSHYPLGRIGSPDECADLALFLASDESAWITAVVVPIDGGLVGTRDLIRGTPSRS